MLVQGKKADLVARLGPALEAEAAERERQREEEERARLQEEERQRQLQLEQKAKQEEQGQAEDGTSPVAMGEQAEGEEEYQEQYTEDGNTEAGTGSAPVDDTPPKSEVCLAPSLQHSTGSSTHRCTACMGRVNLARADQQSVRDWLATLWHRVQPPCSARHCNSHLEDLQARTGSVTTEDHDEWQDMDVPKEWKPLPLIKVC